MTTTTTTKQSWRFAALILGIIVVLGSSTPSWARAPHRQLPAQVGMCAPWDPCDGVDFVPRHPRQPEDDPYYDRDYYDRRDYEEYELPYGSYDPYERTITIPVPAPELPRGTEKIIEGMFELFLHNR